MRLLALTAAALLIAGCGTATDDGSGPSGLTPITPSPATTTATTSATTQTSASTSVKVPTTAPAAGTDIGAVIAWVEAGSAAEPDDFRTATRDGVTSTLDGDVAFVTPSGKTQCITDAKILDGDLACMVTLQNPTENPGVEGHWVPGWVDFDGSTASVGSAHADPGPFAVGKGAALPYGSSLLFGDFACRSDTGGLFCVNFAHRSALKLADTGVQPFGCLTETEPPEGIAEQFACS